MRVKRGVEGRKQMMMGTVIVGVMAGISTAVVSVAAGHPIETTLLVYMTAGLLGSLGFVAASVSRQVDVPR